MLAFKNPLKSGPRVIPIIPYKYPTSAVLKEFSEEPLGTQYSFHIYQVKSWMGKRSIQEMELQVVMPSAKFLTCADHPKYLHSTKYCVLMCTLH